MQKLPDLPPAKMFLDDQESYATNEIGDQLERAAGVPAGSAACR